MENTIIKLKAEAFDLIGIIQEAQRRLTLVNNEIIKLSNETNIEEIKES